MSQIDKIINDGYLAGDTMSSIAKKLNELGLKTPKGHTFAEPSVSGAVTRLKLPRRKPYKKVPRIINNNGTSIKNPDIMPFENERMRHISAFEIPLACDPDWEDNLGFSPYRGPVDGWPNI